MPILDEPMADDGEDVPVEDLLPADVLDDREDPGQEEDWEAPGNEELVGSLPPWEEERDDDALLDLPPLSLPPLEDEPSEDNGDAPFPPLPGFEEDGEREGEEDDEEPAPTEDLLHLPKRLALSPKDLVGLPKELEVHGVLQVVVTEPVETVALKGFDPALRKGCALVDGLAIALAGWVIGPGFDAVAARITIGVDV